jgi:signal transduction histidine kinase/AmiR/NasT family two-component response regulator
VTDQSMSETFWSRVDLLIPVKVRNQDPVSLRSARLLVMLSVVGIVFTIPRAVEESHRFGALAPQLHSYYYTLVALVAIPVAMHLMGSLSLARHLVASIMVVAMPYGITLSGGLFSKDIYSYPLCAWLCVVICGARWGSLYSGIVLAQTLFLGWMHTNGRIETLASEAYGELWTRSASLAFSCFLAWMAAFVQERSYSMALDRLMRSEEEAQAANQAKSRFLAAISHDIRTPLNAILGQIYLLRRRDQSEEERAALDLMEDSSAFLLSMFDQLLELARLRSGVVPVRDEPVASARLIAQIVSSGEVLAERAGVRFECVSSRFPLPDVLVTDALRIQRVALNLILNACKFSERGRRVTFRLSLISARQELSVLCVDEGRGIPAGFQKEIFNEFNRGGLAVGAEHGLAEGVGLGLSIVAEMTRVLNGRINLRSTVGRGTAIRVCVPVKLLHGKHIGVDESNRDELLQDRENTLSAPHRSSEWGADGEWVDLPLEIMSVDDNRMNQLVLTKMLSRLGCSVTQAMNGEEAVALARERRFDLIFMDLQMPGIDGFEAHRQIRRQEEERLARAGGAGGGALGLTPVVALTANAAPEVRDQCLGQGMAGYLKKPIDPRELRAVLSRATQRAGRLERDVTAVTG